MISHIYLYKKLEEEQIGGEFTEEKNFTRTKKKNCREKYKTRHCICHLIIYECHEFSFFMFFVYLSA